MQFLKTVGIFLASVLFAALLFVIVVAIVSVINHVGLYETVRTWFGAESAIGQWLQNL